jgi:hypothetical protein
MKHKISKAVLGIYDLIMAAGATYNGSLMIQSKAGVFAEYPEEWLAKLPFSNWIIPGIIAVVLFGAGNILAGIFSFSGKKGMVWIPSAITGGSLLSGMIASVIALDKWYLATSEFMILGMIQLLLCLYVILRQKRNHTV